MDLSEARIVVLAENQYQELELWYPVLRFREAGSDVLVAAPLANQLYSSKLGLPVVSDVAADGLDPADIDVLVIPGGFAPEAMRKSPELLELVRKTYDGDGIVAAICHAGWVLASTGIAKGKRLTCVPIIRDDVIHAGGEYVNEPVVRDGNLITAPAKRSPAVLFRDRRRSWRARRPPRRWPQLARGQHGPRFGHFFARAPRAGTCRSRDTRYTTTAAFTSV